MQSQRSQSPTSMRLVGKSAFGWTQSIESQVGPRRSDVRYTIDARADAGLEAKIRSLLHV
jgi:hypothetical protein